MGEDRGLPDPLLRVRLRRLQERKDVRRRQDRHLVRVEELRDDSLPFDHPLSLSKVLLFQGRIKRFLLNKSNHYNFVEPKSATKSEFQRGLRETQTSGTHHLFSGPSIHEFSHTVDKTDSFNVSVAAGIMLYETLRQRK